MAGFPCVFCACMDLSSNNVGIIHFDSIHSGIWGTLLEHFWDCNFSFLKAGGSLECHKCSDSCF